MECQNAFCAELNPSTRARLCAYCRPTRTTAHQPLPTDIPALLIDGLIATFTTVNRSYGEGCLLLPGMLFNVTDLFEENYGAKLSLCQREAFLPSRIAYFDRRIMKECFYQDPDFARLLYQNLGRTYTILQGRNNLMTLGSANARIQAILDICTEYGLPQLTHQEIASLTNLNRCTVTSCLKNILKEKTPL